MAKQIIFVTIGTIVLAGFFFMVMVHCKEAKAKKAESAPIPEVQQPAQE